jgi:RNA polymerase-associated protein CTR9
MLIMLTSSSANIYLLMGRFDEAYRIYDFILSGCPQHLFALMGKARILYVRRQFRAALKLYQSVLSAAPDFLPDPRIGIGLCFWNLGEHDLARKAWKRSTVRNPGKSSSGASLLVGLSYINAARVSSLDEEERADTYSEGIQYIQQAWSSDKTCAATAAALSGYFLVSSNKWDTVIKLAELAVQHGDARAVISEGQLSIARALHAQDKPEEATRHYLLAAEANPDQTVASLGVGQMYMQKRDYPSAINTYETILRKQPYCVEAVASLAALHARSAFASSSNQSTSASTEVNSDRTKARELYDQLVTMFQAKSGSADIAKGLDPLGPRIQQVARDPDLYIEIARLWMGDDSAKALNAYRQSLHVRLDNQEPSLGDEDSQVSTSAAGVPPQLLCNIGSLEFGRQQFESAQERFEEAIRLDLERQRANEKAGVSLPEGDAVMMTLMYNLGIVMEARGQKEEAIQLYEQRLLARHPEFIEGKCMALCVCYEVILLILLCLNSQSAISCTGFSRQAN